MFGDLTALCLATRGSGTASLLHRHADCPVDFSVLVGLRRLSFLCLDYWDSSALCCLSRPPGRPNFDMRYKHHYRPRLALSSFQIADLSLVALHHTPLVAAVFLCPFNSHLVLRVRNLCLLCNLDPAPCDIGDWLLNSTAIPSPGHPLSQGS